MQRSGKDKVLGRGRGRAVLGQVTGARVLERTRAVADVRSQAALVQRMGLLGFLIPALATVVLVVVPSPWKWPAVILLIVTFLAILLRSPRRPGHARKHTRKGDDGGSSVVYGTGAHDGGPKHKSHAESRGDRHDSGHNGSGSNGGDGGGDGGGGGGGD